MLRSSLTFAGVFVLGAAASAQTDISSKLRPVTGPIRHAGTYHLATNTWTRKALDINVGADTIYDNTCGSGYYSGLSTDTYVDEGRLPSSSSPTNLGSRPGCNAAYTIDGFELGYCTDQLLATVGTFTVSFFQTYPDCTTAIGLTPTATFALNGLPGSPTAPTANCWIVGIDLDSPPLTASQAFSMAADGDGTYATPDLSNLFGWSIRSTAPGTNTGPLISGDPNTCARYDGTRWDTPTIDYTEAGTGMSSTNHFRVEAGATPVGCYFFNGLPLSSFHLELYSDPCVTPEPGTAFCGGDGVTPHSPCPCGNVSAAGANVGCLHSLGRGGKLRGSSTGPGGIASISADGGGGGPTVQLLGSDMTVNSVLYFQGNTQQNSGNGSPFGDGLRCAGGGILRLKILTNTDPGATGFGSSSYPGVATGFPPISVKGLITTPGTRTYQAWFRNAAAFCVASTFNLTNGYQIIWSA